MGSMVLGIDSPACKHEMAPPLAPPRSGWDRVFRQVRARSTLTGLSNVLTGTNQVGPRIILIYLLLYASCPSSIPAARTLVPAVRHAPHLHL